MARKRIDSVIDEIELPEVNDSLTVADAQLLVKKAIENGHQEMCRCCGQNVKRYQRKLSPILAARLIVFACDFINKGSNKPVPLPTKPTGKTCNVEDLKFWDFIKIEKIKDGDGNKSKVATLTRSGFDFVIGSDEAPQHLFFFANSRVGESETEVDIEDALDDEYDYSKLIKECDTLVAKTKIK